MLLEKRCKHCGTRRMWERGSDNVLRPEKTNGPHGVGHYSFYCGVSPNGRCEPTEVPEGDPASISNMTRELAASNAKRRARIMYKPLVPKKTPA